MIEASHIRKDFTIFKKASGLRGSLKSLFRREWIVKKALQDISFQIQAGEIVALLGGNGAGKTTLVKILAGIIHPTSGMAKVNGFIPWERKLEFRKQVALVMGQKSQLWWDLPAEDCFELLRDIYQTPQNVYQKTLAYLVETLRVENLLNVQIRRLSLGERMKMELIASLLHNPKVIYLDEPTIGLDLTAQKAVRRFLQEYTQAFSPAIILTSHYMEDIKALCSRAILLRQGELIYDGRLEDLHLQKEKQINLLVEEESLENIDYDFPYAKLIRQQDNRLQFSVTQEKLGEALKNLSAKFEIKDISIIEADISATVEKLLNKKEGDEDDRLLETDQP